MSKEANPSKQEILAEYYAKYYHSTLYANSCQSLGTRYFDHKLENVWVKKNYTPQRILEVGFASGEHISKVKQFPTEIYVGVDINEPATLEYISALNQDKRDRVNFVQADAADMPFESGYFDRIVSTCLLHHVADPLRVMQEIRRVSADGGEIAIGLPADPGIINRLIKTFLTYRIMKRLGVENPKLIYALEHPNQIGGLIDIAKFVFKADSLNVSYFPLRIKSWNLNLMAVIHVKVKKMDSPDE